MIYVIALDLATPERNAARVEAWLRQQFPNWAEPLPHLWIVEGAAGADQIRNGLTPMLDPGDRHVVIKAATEAVWHGLGEEAARWLAENFPGSVTERVAGVTEGLTGN